MKILRFAVGASLALASVITTALAAETVNLNNQDYTVSCQGGATAADFNVFGSRLNVSGTCTVTATDASDQDNVIRYPVVVSDGATLIFDFSGLTKGAPRFRSGIYCEGSGKLIVRGSTGFSVGNNETLCKTCPLFRAPDLTFVDADGNEVTGTVTFRDHVGWAGVDPDVNVEIETLGSVTAYTSDFYGRFANGDVMTVSWWNLVVADPTAIPAGMSFRLDRARTLAVCPSTGVVGSMTAVQTSNWTFPCDVVLDHDGARFWIASRYYGMVAGSVTGSGSMEISHQLGGIYLDENVPALNAMRFTSPVNIAGTVTIGAAGAVARFEQGASFKNCTSTTPGIREVVVSGTNSKLADLSSDMSVSCMGEDDVLTVVADKASSPEIIPNGGTVILTNDLAKAVLDRASLWFDASVASSLTQFKLSGAPQYENVGGVDCPIMCRWDDCRGKKDAFLFQDHPSVNYVMPYLSANAQNGLSVLDFVRSENRAVRFYFDKMSSGRHVPQTPKLVIMVFGSHFGGGYALFGNNAGSFARTGNGCDKPILPASATSCRLWLDGKRAADPTQAYFDGGWQVISFDPAGAEINGLALTTDSAGATTSGKQRFGEVLLFDEELSDADRYLVERYLAAKWGLLDKFTQDPAQGVTTRIQGSGTVMLATDAVLGGSFAGTLDLNGNAVRLAQSAPSEAEIAAIDGRLGWFDPSDEASTELSADGRYYVHVNDRVCGAADGAFTVFGNARQCYAGTGDHAGWLDFRRGSGNFLSNGMLMRMKTYPHDTTDTPAQMDVRTIIMVEDSSAGGGTPFLAGTTGNKSAVYQRYESGTPYGYTAGSWRDPVWSADTLADYRNNSSVYVDGVLTDAKVRGFNGRKEVYTTVFNNSDFPLKAFGDIYGNVCTNAAGEKCGELLGEMLMFNRVLTTAEREKVEAYLMRKWCGRSAAGYGDCSAMTVTGAGLVSVPAGAAFPKFAAGFSGAAVFDAATLVFDVDSQTKVVSNAIVAENGTLSFAPAVMVSVSSKKLKAGTYRLVSGAVAAGTIWTLDVSSAEGGLKDAVLQVTDTSVDLVVPATGLMLLFR